MADSAGEKFGDQLSAFLLSLSLTSNFWGRTSGIEVMRSIL